MVVPCASERLALAHSRSGEHWNGPFLSVRCASSPRRRTQLGTCGLVNCALQLLRVLACPSQGIWAHTGKGEGLSCQWRWEQSRSKFAPVEGLVRSQPWRGEGPCSSVCPALLPTALLLPARAGEMLPGLFRFGRWRQEHGEACTDCCPEPERIKHPAGLRQDQNFGMVVGYAWQGCAG